MGNATAEHRPAILVVDDERIVLASLSEWFEREGYEVATAEDAGQALRATERRRFDVALVDIKMPGMDGLELQKRLAAQNPEMRIIMMTAYSSVDSAVRSLKAGAYDYITKPFNPDELTHLVHRAAEHRQLKSENVRLKRQLETFVTCPPIVGESAAMKKVLELVDAVAPTDATVLIKGESGTGKELVARAIHAGSPRRYSPLVVVNCCALPEGILESELFGHEKGAFTGAQYRRRGKFELADGGSILLDEIGAVSQRVQAELLRVLEEKTLTRVGGQAPIPTDFRVIAATNQDLESLVREGRFREDLYWRLDVLTIDIPPLRERPEDIPLLAKHFLEHFSTAMNLRPRQLSGAALEALRQYTWPGNVRELENCIERALVVGSPPRVEVDDLHLRVTDPPLRVLGQSLADVEKAHIEATLHAADWNISKTAKILAVDRGTLYNKLRAYGLRRPEPD